MPTSPTSGPGGSSGGGVTPPVAITGTNPATVPLTVKAAAAQSTEILEVQRSTGVDILDIDSLGQFIFRGPASGGNHTFIVESNDNTRAIDVIDDGSGSVDTLKLGGATIDLAPSIDVRIRGSFLGFYGAATAPQPTVTGAKLPSDAALTSLLTGLASLGLIIDSTT